jgi:response regulator RpfG family c-di-GMP phosphodiesterase
VALPAICSVGQQALPIPEKFCDCYLCVTSIWKTAVSRVENRDDITGGHIERIRRGVGLLVERQALREYPVFGSEVARWDVKLLLQSTRLHDAGKIVISDRILRKSGRLDGEEFEEMKKNAALGIQIIEKIEAGTSASDFCG